MSDSRPVIGDFRSKSDNKPREEAAPAKEVANPPSTITPGAALPAKEDPNLDKLTPVERYRKILEFNEITLAEAEKIFDTVLTKGYYEEVIPVRKNIRAVFRTRAYDDTLRLEQAFEATQPKLVMTQEDLVTRYNMAASLSEWEGKTYKHENDDDFDVVLKVVQKLPGPVYAILANALVKFDRKTLLVFSDGATENFS